MKWLAITVGILFLYPGSVLAEEMTGRAIMEKQKELHKVKTDFEIQKMLLIDKSGKKEVREVRRYVKEIENDVYRSLIVFMAPADIKGTALLSWQHKDQPDDQWLYLPASGKMQRIAKGSKKNYFMGTDFTYEDMQSEDLDDYKYNNVGKEACDDAKECYMVEAIPADKKKAKESGYSKRKLWVRIDNFVTVKTEFYDRRKKLLKTQITKGWKQLEGSVWRADTSVMERFKTKHKTAVKSAQTEINKPIADKTFTERFITKGEHIQ